MITYWDSLPVFEAIAALLSVLYCSFCEMQMSMLHKKHLILRCIQITRKSTVVLNLEWAIIGNPSTWFNSRSERWLLFMSSYGPHFVWYSLCTLYIVLYRIALLATLVPVIIGTSVAQVHTFVSSSSVNRGDNDCYRSVNLTGIKAKHTQ